MAVTIKNALILCKKSFYQIYFLRRRNSSVKEFLRIETSTQTDFKKSHEEHYRALAEVQRVMRARGIRFKIRYRGQKIDYTPFDFVISVGGDGTFLEAARHIGKQIILGVNSDPKRSVGRFCSTDRKGFSKALASVLSGRCKISSLNRIRLKLNNTGRTANVLNDILVCHKNPAAMSRYCFTINGVKEEQRSSGLWIATAAGSSGAIHSAGGKLIPRDSKLIQYMPRELFQSHGIKCCLKGDVLMLRQPMIVRSMMRSGVIYVDGAHLKFSFGFGDIVSISLSKEPLRVIDF
ncbi:MAG TPA: NAD(+)/NADH kinase [Candidatus Omnitrophota bacterium]|nr:NAD(+)/NADH kinase [Candidatus Omnitrophota bacterium]HPD85470.1 NAD(+)/NADH kinase [Candidatus Omnitrophota bacterium]HRZ04029.1 NAD(+)/NADH kinase [Candidatus Omnitrophota bacterium]